MSDKSAAPVVSPDGRFEVIIEDLYDRGIHAPYTVLVERATGKQLFTCQGEPRAVFAGDGMLTIHYPGYEPGGVQIDPVRCAFRTHPSDPWIPAAAWSEVESAYRRGWAQGIKFQQENRMSPTPTPFPWVAISLLLGSIVALPALVAQTFLSDNMRVMLVVVAAVGVLFFGWLTASDVRAWMQEGSTAEKTRYTRK
jgi:hypothetical protein